MTPRPIAPDPAFDTITFLLRGVMFAGAFASALAWASGPAAAGPLDAVVGVRAVIPEDAPPGCSVPSAPARAW